MATQLPFQDISEWLDYWLRAPRLPEEEQAVLERYYYSYMNHFGDYLRRHYSSQINEAEKFILKMPKCRVLEIGSGCGTESLWLGLKGASVTGIDLNEDRLKVAAERSDHTRKHFDKDLDVEFRKASVFEAKHLGRFDCIWMEQAFHHVEPRDDFLDFLPSLLRPHGVFIISESNALNPLIQMRLLLKRGFRTIRYFKDENGLLYPYGDERITTAARIGKELECRGFAVDSVRHFRLFPNRSWADRFSGVEQLTPTWLKPLYTHYNLVARRQVDA